MSTPSERRQVENEAMFRAANENVQKNLQETLPQDDYNSWKLHFYCECSDAACNARIIVTPQIYQKLHIKRNRFIVKPGHERPDIEKIVQEFSHYLVVQKFLQPPEQPRQLHHN